LAAGLAEAADCLTTGKALAKLEDLRQQAADLSPSLTYSHS
jgi:hypothetical protein